MTTEQLLILAILIITMAMFLWGRWRHDMVGAAALLACVLAGLVPPLEAFAGFGHPAVITVACVLVLSRGLQTSGVVDALTRTVLPSQAGVTLSMTALIGLGAVLSGFMNNIGAMALLMPVALQMAKRLNLTPGQILMPLAFGTILGGMTTMIGTPPNMIVAGFRAETGSESFSMFDFTHVGLVVAFAGLAFILLLGQRLIPIRKQIGVEGFESGAYITEARVPKESKAVGMTLREIETALDDNDTQVIGMVRNDVRLSVPNQWRKILAEDILILEAEAETLADALSTLGLKLEEAVQSIEKDETEKNETKNSNKDKDKEETKEEKEDVTTSDEIVLRELAVLPDSHLTGRSASNIQLRTRYNLNLLALSRRGQLSIKRLRTARLEAGDLLLMQGSPESISEFAADYSCVPLAQRDLRIPDKSKIWKAGIIMALAVGVAALGLLPASISFAMGVLVSMALRTVPLRDVYESIDWPVIMLLSTLIPVAGAMESTGTADLIARLIIEKVAYGNAVIGLTLILVITMFLSDMMNNAATAAVMCPISIGTASALGVNADSFLMAVAIGASCAFLTPVGHQNNTLILGPGGFRFGDYWRLGLPLEILIVVISIPMLLVVWPL
ncbi:SLC13 family permease [Sulfurimonas sp. CVO]|jgi:di/tricarboxylate transporter|uniref:SLC13 family permease n=1 Tax=Sulfurimonas sp. CVO TaxID=2283483 RepID=UPI00132E9046|nr:SLC13 family permease [Sulfurimonas sp. CVO]QHG91409.1 SLC13 family permease [Sulfurimonas sp. CVO]